MTPGARVQAAIEILDHWRAADTGLDRILAAWARQNRYAGGGDRRAIADHCYDALRRRRSAAWVAGADDGRGLILGALRLDGQDPAAFFTGARYAPEMLGESERGAGHDLSDAPRAVRLDVPDWLVADLDEVGDADLAALRDRAPLDLRVNTLKTTRAEAVAALAVDGVVAQSVAHASSALRVTEGARKVAASAAYAQGLVEIQDTASQAVAAFAGAKPGMTVLDLCAGGGGKTLALGAVMAGEGRLLAHDIAPGRMKDLTPRAARAGVKVESVETGSLHGLSGSCDLVVVDAPCSGSGAWRRNPDHKWRLTRDALERLEATQAALLDQAAGLCAPGGAIAYMTCSILPRENRPQVDRFLDRLPGRRFEEELALGPAGGTDGFYAARLRLDGC